MIDRMVARAAYWSAWFARSGWSGDVKVSRKRSEVNVFVDEAEAIVTGEPVQSEVVPILDQRFQDRTAREAT